jgi:hypothetical protein
MESDKLNKRIMLKKIDGVGKINCYQYLRGKGEKNMGCKRQITKSECKPNQSLHKRSVGQNSEESVTNNLEEIGREQFFQHYPKSSLPIRDITQKTEPHIEIGAENYLRECIQPNIRGFCHNPEKYLFLCTTCKNKEVENGKFFGKRFVVGYIKKKSCKKMDEHRLAVIGKPYLVPFDGDLEYEKLKLKRSRAMQRFDEKETQKLLGLIHQHGDITADCVKKMIDMEKEKEIGQEECLEGKCEFKNNCLRRKL